MRPDGAKVAWIDTLGHESLYDYDPVWQRCLELGVVADVPRRWARLGYARVHAELRAQPPRQLRRRRRSRPAARCSWAACRGASPGCASRSSRAASPGAASSSPTSWATTRSATARRSRTTIRASSISSCAASCSTASRPGPIAERRKQYEDERRAAQRLPADHPMGYDDFAESGIRESAGRGRRVPAPVQLRLRGRRSAERARLRPRAPAARRAPATRCSPPTSATGTSPTCATSCPRPGSWSRTGR